MPRKNANVSLTSYDDIFGPEESYERVQEIPLEELHPFKNHPFKVIDDESMLRTVESVARYGVLAPAIARPRVEGGYELVAGHRRHHASELAGKETMPVIVRELDDDAAVILMVDSNLQRERILPSERAFAYKMKMDAIKHQGSRSDLTSGQVVQKSSLEQIAEGTGESYKQVQRYIRLTELIPELLKMVDEGIIKFNPAVELSFLKKEEQENFIEAMDEFWTKAETLLYCALIGYIHYEGQVYKYLINNAPYSAYIKVVKADKETGAIIPLTGAGFEIYNASGEKVSMSYTYPTLTTIDTYYVSADGYLITPQVLPAGDYTLVEVQAPYGYVLDNTPIPFTVTMAENEEVDGINVITVTAYDMAQKGKITVSKTGEVFSSVTVSGDEAMNKQGEMELINCVYQPVFSEKGLAGATYQVIAAEDIVTGDGTLRYEKGTAVDEITTGEDGTATSKELYLGKYDVVEVKAPIGFVLNATPSNVELVYAGQEVSVTDAAAAFCNDRQKIEISALKAMKQDEAFGIGMNGEITAVSFGLYAKEEIIAADGSKIPADGLIEIAFCDAEGNVRFQSDVPFGRYYVTEVSTDPHYMLNGRIYSFEFVYAGQEVGTATATLNEGKAIENELIRGTIKGLKVDGEEKGLAGATFGLFNEWEQEYTKENAYLTVVSDENGAFKFENVPFGDYVVVELEAPEGYVKSDARHFVSVTYDTQVIGIKAINYLIVGSVQLTKVDAEYPDNKLTGVGLTVFSVKRKKKDKEK